jgi:GT2 family glycosyltransferase
MAAATISTVIVAHNSLDDLRRSLPPLCAELDANDELIVVDSGSSDPLGRELPALAPHARLIVAPGNVGFAAGANLGAAAAGGRLLVFLNPDAVVRAGWAQAIARPYGSDLAAWMALVTMDGGTLINSSGGVVHFTGVGWSGQPGRPVGEAPHTITDVGFLSGACLAIPAVTWRTLGGFSEDYFMYCEDVDLSLRLRLRGGRIAVVPDAQVIHAYEFDKGMTKWRLLERNRWFTIVRNYPGILLALLLPVLLGAEFCIWIVALRGGWGKMKVLATLDVVRALPRLARERRAIEATRAVSAATFAAAMTPELSSPYLGDAVRHPLLAAALRAYWGVVVRALSVSSRVA